MSKRSKACEISQKTKKEVWNRDKQQCIICRKWVPKSCANAHFIKRSQRRIRHTRKYSHIMPGMSFPRRFWTEYQIIRTIHRKLFKRHLRSKLGQGKFNL